MIRRVVAASCIAAVGIAGPLFVRARAQNGARLETAQVAALKWRSIGPANTGGRVDDFAVARVPGAPDAIYVGTASGGVFKSVNQGTSWTPVFDGMDAMMSIGDITVAPSNPNVVWVGTGESNNRQSSSWGDGVYKSVDGGTTWKNMGLKDTRHINRIVIHPSDPDTVYVAAVGHLWGSNAERGVFKTTDGGRTWTKVLFVDENTGANDIVIDPQDPETLIASTYQRQRKPWGYNGGGPGSNIYRTNDGGATWTKLTSGLPTVEKGRIGLDLWARDGRVVYAIVEAGRPAGRGGEGGGNSAEGGVFRSVDRGDTWEHLTNLNPRPSYYSQIRVDPKDRSRVYILGSNRGFYISDDGGRNFRDVFSTIHSEDHALWVDPDDPNHLIIGGDGGVSISWDRGATWLFRDNLPLGQFYEIGADMKEPYTVCGGLQDNGVWCVPSATMNRNGIANRDGWNIGSGDGFYARIDPTDPNTVVLESQGGRANRVNLVTLERQFISPVGTEKPKPGEEALRWNWDTPLVMSSSDPSVYYMGAQMVFRSADRGVTWSAISPDLTAHIDRDKLEMMGARVSENALSRHDGQSNYGSLTTIAESPLDPKLLYTGSDDGQLQVTRDGGAKWTNITAKVPGLPANTYASSVLASKHAAGRVYATFDGHFSDDYRPYVYVSDDYGQTWRSLSAGLPETSVNRLREGLTNPRLLFLGHERGLHMSIDGGAAWTSLNTNMPTVPVDDLLLHPRDHDLIVGTHGRSIWILDQIDALEALTPQMLTTAQSLLPSPRARLLSIYNPQAWYGAGQFFAPNPEFGAAITYYLRDASAADVQIEISDAGGSVVRTLRAPGKRGVNRAAWDLRIEPPVAGEQQAAGAGGFGGSPTGPLVLPGKYSVTLKAGPGREARGDVTVDGDPRITFADADRRTRQTQLLNIYDLQKSLAAARTAARTVETQTAAIRKDVGKGPLDQLASEISRVTADIDRELNAATGLSRAIEAYSGLPTADQRRQIDWAFEDATKTIDELNRLLQTDVPAAYGDLLKQGLWPKRPQPVAAPPRRPAA
jgi:photosystem II stability/assembly factor-like uncharacterized protein